MSRKNENAPASRPAPIRWEFDSEIPTLDFLEGGSLDEIPDLQEAVESFIYYLEKGSFLQWEAVVCDEQGLALTPAQQEAIGGLISFDENQDDKIHEIDGSPRPTEPWYVILGDIAAHLLIERFHTSEYYYDVQTHGWNSLMTALETHGEWLSLPPGAASVDDVVPLELRHKLWLQYCLDALGGLGQDESLTLANPEQDFRIEWFIERLRERKDTVEYFGLTINSLLSRFVLPVRDQPIFVKRMQEALNIGASEPIADRL